jgi:hypothetical protein
MKKMFIVAMVTAFALAACGGKKKHDNKPHTGSGSAMHDGSAAGSGDHGSGDHGSAAPAPTP